MQTIGVPTIEPGTIARRLVDLAEDKQAHEIVLLDIRSQSTIADYFVICSADSDRQIKAIIDHIDLKVQQEFGLNPRIEGTADTGWIVLDYGDIVVHIFSPTQRDYYRLERLWDQSPPVVVVQ
ncbi:ribosome silencing factor [Candidatus Viridilinea mediisalina]|uniref:Ribosomal silencing factor RsfS n=1 Tax=Candidatus Viridilinea mediisalina TaxID=2024553 RepID=A0A2A6RKW6_9CHLR|nr:ribosome silencing factor [Candidatus Viridilinea mediisalina]PDW03536.1 ribosome silencing factor [Candidatus Viridilinea mediisalina]